MNNVCNDAFEAFFRRYTDDVRRLVADAGAVPGGRSETDDVVADIFLNVWRSGKWCLKDSEELEVWLAEISQSVLSVHESYSKRDDALRRRLQDRVVTADVADDVANALHHREYLQAASAALLRLSAEEQEVISLALEEGLSYIELSERLGVPLGTLRSRLSRGRKRLWELTIQETVRAQWRRKMSRSATRTSSVYPPRMRRSGSAAPPASQRRIAIDQQPEGN